MGAIICFRLGTGNKQETQGAGANSRFKHRCFRARVVAWKDRMSLRAYFDESGTHWNGRNASTVFVLCGYVAPEEVWDQTFEEKWTEMLRKPNIFPELEYFHAEGL